MPWHPVFSLSWWRDRLSRASSGFELSDDGRRAFARAELTIARALEEFRSTLGSAFVDAAVTRMEGAWAGTHRPPRAFKARVARAELARRSLAQGAPPSDLDAALFATVVGQALPTVTRLKGVEPVIARLSQDAGDDAAFEILTAAIWARALGTSQVEFLKPDQQHQRPDLVIGAPLPRYGVECKRQRDRSAATTAREQAADQIGQRLNRLRPVTPPVTVHISLRDPGDGASADWAVSTCASALRALRLATSHPPGPAFDFTAASGDARVVIVVRAPDDGSLHFDASHLLRGTVPFSGSLPIRLTGISGPVVPDMITQFNFGHEQLARDAKNLIGRAAPQLQITGGGVLAVWSRSSRSHELEHSAAAFATELAPEKNTRVSGVLLMRGNALSLFADDRPSALVDQRWVPHPAPQCVVDWPLVR